MDQKSPDSGAGRRRRRALRWLAHVLVALLVVVMVNLGLWQLRRLDERQELNDTVREHAAAEPLALPEEFVPGAVEAIEWRPVTIEGTYVDGTDVLVANRTLGGIPGYWVVTAFEPADRTGAVAVVRGFVTRASLAEGVSGDVAAPPGTVRVTGYAQASRGGGRFATTPSAGELPEITRMDLDALAARWDVDLAPLWVQLREQQPPIQGRALTPVPLPDLDEGPHFAYAVQWFIFSAIAAIGYPLVLRRTARAREPAMPMNVRGDGQIQ